MSFEGLGSKHNKLAVLAMRLCHHIDIGHPNRTNVVNFDSH